MFQTMFVINKSSPCAQSQSTKKQQHQHTNTRTKHKIYLKRIAWHCDCTCVTVKLITHRFLVAAFTAKWNVMCVCVRVCVNVTVRVLHGWRKCSSKQNLFHNTIQFFNIILYDNLSKHLSILINIHNHYNTRIFYVISLVEYSWISSNDEIHKINAHFKFLFHLILFYFIFFFFIL